MFCSLLACAQTAAVLQTGVGIYILTCSLTAARGTAAHLSTQFQGRIGLAGLRVIAGRSQMEENAVMLPCCRSKVQRSSDNVTPSLSVLEACRCGHWSCWTALIGAS